jgi:hypothetical protein
MDMSSDVSNATVMMSYMDTSCDVAHVIVVTSYIDMSSDVAHVIVVTPGFLKTAFSPMVCLICTCSLVVYVLREDILKVHLLVRSEHQLRQI